MKKKRLNDATRACEGLRQKAQVTGKSRLNNRLERRAGKGTLNAGRTLWLAENKGLSKLTRIKLTLNPKCITKIRYLAARPLNVDEIKGEVLLGARLEGGVAPLTPPLPVGLIFSTEDENARSALECGRSSYRLGDSARHDGGMWRNRTAVAAATALQVGHAQVIQRGWRARRQGGYAAFQRGQNPPLRFPRRYRFSAQKTGSG